jgi:hypothetical protein
VLLYVPPAQHSGAWFARHEDHGVTIEALCTIAKTLAASRPIHLLLDPELATLLRNFVREPGQISAIVEPCTSHGNVLLSPRRLAAALLERLREATMCSSSTVRVRVGSAASRRPGIGGGLPRLGDKTHLVSATEKPLGATVQILVQGTSVKPTGMPFAVGVHTTTGQVVVPEQSEGYARLPAGERVDPSVRAPAGVLRISDTALLERWLRSTAQERAAKFREKEATIRALVADFSELKTRKVQTMLVVWNGSPDVNPVLVVLLLAMYDVEAVAILPNAPFYGLYRMLLHGVQSTDGVAFHIEGEPVLYSDVMPRLCPLITTFSIVPGRLMRSHAAEMEFADVVRATNAYHVVSSAVTGARPVRLYLAIDLNKMPHENNGLGIVLSDACHRMFNNGKGEHGAFIRLPTATLTGLSFMATGLTPYISFLAGQQKAPRACADSGMFAHNMPLADLVAAIEAGGAGAVKTGAKLPATCTYCPTKSERKGSEGMCAGCIQATLAEMGCIPKWMVGIKPRKIATLIAQSDAAVRASAIVEAERNELNEEDIQRALRNVGRFVDQDALPKAGTYQGAGIVLPKPELGLDIEKYRSLFSVFFPRIEAADEETDSDDDDDEFAAGGAGESDGESDDESDDEPARSAKRRRTSATATSARAARETARAAKRAEDRAVERLLYELTSA